jgi:hypothetical protein
LEKKSKTTSVSTKLAFEVKLPSTLRRAGLLQSNTDLSESQLVKICIDGIAGWDNTHFVRFVSAVLINQTSFDGRLSISIVRSGPSVIQDKNGNRHSYWFQSLRYMSQYSPRSCNPQTQQSGTLVDVLPSIGGACYTVYLLGTIPNLDANMVRFVFELETKSGAGDVNIPASWKLIDFDKLPVFFGCSKSPQTECKLHGKFWCETDLMCVLDCSGCSHRPVAVPSFHGNECTLGQISSSLNLFIVIGSIVGAMCCILAACFCLRMRSTSNSNSSGDVTNPSDADSEEKLSKDLGRGPGRGVQRGVARSAGDGCEPYQPTVLVELVHTLGHDLA